MSSPAFGKWYLAPKTLETDENYRWYLFSADDAINNTTDVIANTTDVIDKSMFIISTTTFIINPIILKSNTVPVRQTWG
jgi:hypothetical protein